MSSVRLKVDVLVTPSTAEALAAKNRPGTVRIVGKMRPGTAILARLNLLEKFEGEPGGLVLKI